MPLVSGSSILPGESQSNFVHNLRKRGIDSLFNANRIESILETIQIARMSTPAPTFRRSMTKKTKELDKLKTFQRGCSVEMTFKTCETIASANTENVDPL